VLGVQVIDISNNNFTGNHPPSPFHVFHCPIKPILQFFDFVFHSDTGKMPVAIPNSALRYLKMDGNNLYDVGALPKWAKKTSSYVVSPIGLFSCPTVTTTTDSVQLFIDASYYDYSGCICSRGTYGFAPNCNYIPPTSQLQVADSPLQSTMFSPAEFGENRVTVGMDTSWLIAPPASSSGQLPVVIYLTFWINHTIFDAPTDVSYTLYIHSLNTFLTLSCLIHSDPRP
jgi:hypothetical protein